MNKDLKTLQRQASRGKPNHTTSFLKELLPFLEHQDIDTKVIFPSYPNTIIGVPDGLRLVIAGKTIGIVDPGAADESPQITPFFLIRCIEEFGQVLLKVDTMLGAFAGDSYRIVLSYKGRYKR